MSNDSTSPAGSSIAVSELSRRGRYIVLVAAFLGWMCAGMQMSNFPLATGAIVRDILGSQLAEEAKLTSEEREQIVKVAAGKWFGYFICSFLLGAAT